LHFNTICTLPACNCSIRWCRPYIIGCICNRRNGIGFNCTWTNAILGPSYYTNCPYRTVALQ
jgi:hypothetical protein